MGVNSLASKLQRAKAVMDVTSTPTFDKYASDLRNGGFIEDPYNISEYNIPKQAIPQQAFQENKYSRESYNGPITESMVERSNLPKEILDSLMEKPLDAPNTTLTDSNMTNLMNKVQEGIKYMPKVEKPKFSNTLNEVRQQQQQPTVIASANVDYSLMKTIVEDVVKRYAGALKKQILSELKGNLNESVGGKTANGLRTMMIGNKFNFVDDEGNIYEAELKYKGNVKNKKK